MPAVVTPVRSLSELLAVRSAEQGDRRAYTFLECGDQDAGHLTWRQLERRSRSIASAIRGRVQPGARVLLLFPPGLDFVTALFAAFSARTIAVPAYPPSGARGDRVATRLRGMIADAGVELVVTTAAVAARADGIRTLVPGLATLPWLSVDELPDDPAAAVPSPPAADDIAFLQYTSGSTAAPRGVMVTHANLLHNLADSGRLGRHDASSISVSWLPVNHDMGLIQGVLQPAFSGFPAWLMSPVAFLQRPARWLEAISTLRATHSGGPNFAFDLCARRISDADRDALDLRSWRVAFSGSEPVRTATIEAFARTFSRAGFRPEALRPSYGLAESTLLVTSTRPNQPPRTLSIDTLALRHGRVAPRLAESPDGPYGPTSIVVGCGWTGDTTRIAIVDPASCRRCGTGEVGEIWVAGGSVARGYWRRPDETRAAFAARLADTGDGPFLRTGDLGFIHEGELFVTGRIKDAMIVRGLKHDPHDVELTVEAADPAIRPGGCAAFMIDADSEAVAAAVEIGACDRDGDAGHRDRLMEAIRTAVAAGHGIQLAAVVLLPPGALPKTTSGKVQRFACREGLRSGSLAAIARWHAPGSDWTLERTA